MSQRKEKQHHVDTLVDGLLPEKKKLTRFMCLLNTLLIRTILNYNLDMFNKLDMIISDVKYWMLTG